MMSLSVLVPSYRRASDLDRCLGALAGQTRQADQVLVVARDGDGETMKVATSWCSALPLKIVEVTVPGQVQALNAGLARVRGDIVAITDDDAAPRPDWLARIEAHFLADPRLGGVGGRDWVYQDGILEAGERRTVGKVLWFGRIAGNHHLGTGPAREVDILKGANCAFRMSAIGPIGFDSRLKGTGAQVHNDMMASLAVKRAGWRLLYDPLVAVDHYLAKRFDADVRFTLNAKVIEDRSFNFRLTFEELPFFQTLPCVVWMHLVGSWGDPGILWLIRFIIFRRYYHAWTCYLAALYGRREASRLISSKRNFGRHDSEKVI